MQKSINIFLFNLMHELFKRKCVFVTKIEQALRAYSHKIKKKHQNK